MPFGQGKQKSQTRRLENRLGAADADPTGRAQKARHGARLQAACALYLKSHSYGEYVFDWAWARAYEQHGLPYYPKLLGAVPFTPVPGTRLLARDPRSRRALAHAVVDQAQAGSG